MPVKSHQPARKKPAETRRIHLKVNHQDVHLEVGGDFGQIDACHTLAQTLRETLGLTGTKVSCDNGACGCCTVLMDGKAVLSCMTLTVECDGKDDYDHRGPGDLKKGSSIPSSRPLSITRPFSAGFALRA